MTLVPEGDQITCPLQVLRVIACCFPLDRQGSCLNWATFIPPGWSGRTPWVLDV